MTKSTDKFNQMEQIQLIDILSEKIAKNINKGTTLHVKQLTPTFYSDVCMPHTEKPLEDASGQRELGLCLKWLIF